MQPMPWPSLPDMPAAVASYRIKKGQKGHWRPKPLRGKGYRMALVTLKRAISRIHGPWKGPSRKASRFLKDMLAQDQKMIMALYDEGRKEDTIMPAVSIYLPDARVRELRRVALRLSLEKEARVTLSSMAREALDAMWPSEAKAEHQVGGRASGDA